MITPAPSASTPNALSGLRAVVVVVARPGFGPQTEMIFFGRVNGKDHVESYRIIAAGPVLGEWPWIITLLMSSVHIFSHYGVLQLFRLLLFLGDWSSEYLATFDKDSICNASKCRRCWWTNDYLFKCPKPTWCFRFRCYNSNIALSGNFTGGIHSKSHCETKFRVNFTYRYYDFGRIHHLFVIPFSCPSRIF